MSEKITALSQGLKSIFSRFGAWLKGTAIRFAAWGKEFVTHGAWEGLKTACRCTGLWLKDNFAMRPSEAAGIALSGLIFRNPTLVLLLGLCPALAVTTSLEKGVAMGLTTAAVLVCSSLVISLLRKVIPQRVRILFYLGIIAVFVTGADLLMDACFPAMRASLGLYVPLIAVNSILLSRAETFAALHEPGRAALDGLCCGLGFTAALAILGAIREVLGAGTIWGYPIPLLSEYPAQLILTPCGGFILLGCLAAFVQFLRNLSRKGGGEA